MQGFKGRLTPGELFLNGIMQTSHRKIEGRHVLRNFESATHRSSPSPQKSWRWQEACSERCLLYLFSGLAHSSCWVDCQRDFMKGGKSHLAARFCRIIWTPLQVHNIAACAARCASNGEGTSIAKVGACPFPVLIWLEGDLTKWPRTLVVILVLKVGSSSTRGARCGTTSCCQISTENIPGHPVSSLLSNSPAC